MGGSDLINLKFLSRTEDFPEEILPVTSASAYAQKFQPDLPVVLPYGFGLAEQALKIT